MSIRTASRHLPLRAVAVAIVALGFWHGALAAPVHAQQGQPSNQQLLQDFIHYVLIRNDDLAKANANALLARGMTPVEFVGMIEDSGREAERFEHAIRAAMVIPATEETAGHLFRLFEQGKLDRSRDPAEIAQNIQFLVQNPRARMLATDRLRNAGEYAAPQLLQVLLARANPALETEVQRVLILMGADAVAPLCAALLDVDPPTQERLSLILGQIRSPASLPYLQELRDNAPSDAVRATASRVMQRIEGGEQTIPLSERYLTLAEAHYAEQISLTRFRGEPHQLIWTFNPGVGLFPTAIRSQVFHKARAMQLAERALELDNASERAVSLWIAANFSREIDMPEGYDDPSYDPQRRDARYYAVAAGTRITQSVLGRALRDNNTPLARRALDALRMTVGDASVTEPGPLLDALTYPDRRVQYEAALALAAARPKQPFPGSERVAPLLASAVRDAGVRYAAIVATRAEDQQRLNELLTAEGFIVLPPAPSLAGLSGEIAEAPGVDILITAQGESMTRETIAEARMDPRLRATPVLAVLPFESQVQFFFDPTRDRLMRAVRLGVSDSEILESVAQLSEEALGPIVENDEAYIYAMSALAALRDLAVAGGSVVDPNDAMRPLVAALDELIDDDLRYEVARVLASLDNQSAQQALMNAAIRVEGPDRVDLLELVAESAKRFGNMLDARQIAQASRMADDASDDVATAAAALLGALNLRDRELAPLILGR